MNQKYWTFVVFMVGLIMDIFIIYWVFKTFDVIPDRYETLIRELWIKSLWVVF